MMKSIKQIMNETESPYTGSSFTREIAEDAIKQKYGEAEAKKLDCYHNLRSYKGWLSLGFQVKKGEKAIRSFTIVEVKDGEGNVVKKIKRPVFLFYYKAVEPAKKDEKENDD